MGTTVCFEHPLNERIRLFLRLDHLFKQYDQACSQLDHWQSRLAFSSLFDLLEIIGRNEIKADIIKELDHFKKAFEGFQDAPGVNKAALESVCAEIQDVLTDVHSFTSLALDAYRQQDFFNTIRQRDPIPGGTCAFDLPELHHWLHCTDLEQRQDYFATLFQSIQPIQTGIYLILRLIRRSSAPRQQAISKGQFQQVFSQENDPPQMQLVRLVINKTLAVYPEVSGNQHKISIRFLQQRSPKDKAALYTEPFDCAIACCSL